MPDQAQSRLGQEWAISLERFQQDHREWWSRFGCNGPLYRLPQQIIGKLANEDLIAKTPLLSGTDAAAEQAFRKLCEFDGGNAVGVWGDRCVHYPLFDFVPPAPLSEALIHAAKWEVPRTCLEADMKEAIGKIDAAQHQQLGHAGQLTFDEEYQKERVRLIELSRPFSGSLIWPLLASRCEQPPYVLRHLAPRKRPNPVAVTAFFHKLACFLRKYQLTGLATWDLPLPQGPLESASLEQARYLLGPDQVVTTLPTYFDIPSHTDLRAETRDQQRRAAKQAGIATAHPLTQVAARNGHASTLETAFRMWFLERTVRSRYGRPRGMTARLESAFIGVFKVTQVRIQQVRHLYLPFLDR